MRVTNMCYMVLKLCLDERKKMLAFSDSQVVKR